MFSTFVENLYHASACWWLDATENIIFFYSTEEVPSSWNIQRRQSIVSWFRIKFPLLAVEVQKSIKKQTKLQTIG